MLLWTIIEVAVNILQGCMMVQFMKNRLHHQNHHYRADVLCVSLIALFFSLYLFCNVPIPELAVFVIPLIYGVIITDEKWYVAVFWALVLCLEFTTIVSMLLHIFLFLPGFSDQAIVNASWQRLLFILVSNAVLASTLYAISRIRIVHFALNWKPLLLFILLNFGLSVTEESVYYVQQMYQTPEDMWSFLAAYLGIAFCTFLSIFLFSQLSLSVQREEQIQQEFRSVEQSKRYNEEIQAMYAQLQKERHDFKQQVQLLQQMLSSYNQQNATQYLTQYQQKLMDDMHYLTGSPAVDAMLTAKSLMMTRSGISFRYTAYPLTELPIDDVDFCTILGNILDNAIEGTQRLKEPGCAQPIHLTFSRSWDMFYIFCTNECVPQTIHYGEKGWMSSKAEDGTQHGIGIRSVQQIVQKAEGRYAFCVDKNIVRVKVVLPFRSKVKNEESAC